MSWARLKKAYDKSGLVLVVGAGISAGCGLPSWDELLQRVFDDLPQPVNVDDLKNWLSLSAIASLIEERVKNRREFEEKVREALYRCFPFFPDGVDKRNRREYVRFINEKNETLRSVVALCTKREPNKHTYTINDRIHAVVNLNLDALLQAYDYARHEKRLLRTIERASAGSRSNKISVYHLHGFLRFDERQRDLTKEAPDSVVLTEQNYFDFFNQPTRLFNYTFLHLLREYPCLFIGLSMRDDNIRRLLHYSKLEQDEAYYQEGVTNEKTLRRKLARHFAILDRHDNPIINKAREQTLRPLGVTVLWVDDFSEIPVQFEALYGSTEAWQIVF